MQDPINALALVGTKPGPGAPLSSFFRGAPGASLLPAIVLLFATAAAQDGGRELLMNQIPFDVLTLDKANEGRVYKVYPVRLPGRRIPEKPKPTDKLRVKLIEDDQEYDVAWQNIAKLELYEQMVVAEVNKLATDGKLDEAYDELDFLLTFYPNTAGLPEARQNYLYLSSAGAYRQQKYDEALALLEELYAINPNFRPASGPTLVQRMGDVADRLIATNVEKRDFRAARALLDRLTKQYKADGEPFAKKWREQLAEMAAQYRDEAKGHLEASHFIEAHDAATMMRAIWPDVSGGKALAEEIARRHPMVRVGVEHPAISTDRLSLIDMAARRAGRLTQRLFVECTAVGVEGGKYESPVAQIVPSDDRLSLLFRLNAADGGLTSASLARRLLARATAGSPEYDASWGQAVSTIAARGPSEVEVSFRAARVLPEALLQMPLTEANGSAANDQPYTLLSRDASLARYAANSSYVFRRPTQPAEIAERYFGDPQRAMVALKQGEIDLLDRVFPGDIAPLRSDDSIVVAPFAAPTTHVLAVRSEHPYLANREFRRALIYGANRELLLSQGLLRGATIPGFRVVSGPFPAPAAGLELPTYGYDAQVEPRPFDPRLGMALVLLSENEVKAVFEKQQKQAPKRAPLVLGHPADETSRIACRGLVKDWKRIGVECKLVEFPPGVFDDAAQKCDLVYLQLGAWEPIIDARRLFGNGGIAPAMSSFTQLALREVDAARNWQQAHERLVTLHRLIHEEVTILPLWQTMDHFAYRKTLRGLTPRRLSLYQDVEQWQTAPQLARSEP
jgi:hypothetical protein